MSPRFLQRRCACGLEMGVSLFSGVPSNGGVPFGFPLNQPQQGYQLKKTDTPKWKPYSLVCYWFPGLKHPEAEWTVRLFVEPWFPVLLVALKEEAKGKPTFFGVLKRKHHEASTQIGQTTPPLGNTVSILCLRFGILQGAPTRYTVDKKHQALQSKSRIKTAARVNGIQPPRQKPKNNMVLVSFRAGA